jgi:hypothetical protein
MTGVVAGFRWALLQAPGIRSQTAYREANRAVSRNDFIAKTCAEHRRSIGIVEKEAAETEYWLALFDASDIGAVAERRWLLGESGELLAIFAASGRTAKSHRP